MWAEELYLHIRGFEAFIENYPLRGIMGPVGTQFDMGKLLESQEKTQQLEDMITDELGFKEVLNSRAERINFHHIIKANTTTKRHQ